MKNSLEEQLDRRYVVKRSLRQHTKRIMARIIRTVLINRFTISVYSLMSKDAIQDFSDAVFANRFDRYMQGFDREAVAKMIETPPGRFAMGVEKMGSMRFDKLPVDISDTLEPEIKAFTIEDVVKSENILVDTVVDGEHKKRREFDIQDFKTYFNA